MNSLEGRIRRHMKKRKNFWHIDYLLDISELSGILTIESEKKIECEIALYLSKRYRQIDGFGSTDCSCKSHLFFLDR